MTQAWVDLDTSIGYALKQAATALRAAIDAALLPLELNVSQYSCLELLGQRPGLSAAELARGTFVTRQSMHALLRGLQARGLLAPVPAPTVGRALPVSLTPAGKRLLTRASAVVAEVEGRMLDDLGARDRKRLLADLVACTNALRGG